MAEGVANNDNFTVNLALTDPAGDPYDLTGDTVIFRWRLNDVFRAPTMTQTNTTGGLVSYTIASSELDAGTVSYEVDVVDGVSDVLTSLTTGTFSIREKISSG